MADLWRIYRVCFRDSLTRIVRCILLFGILSGILVSCSTRKNTAASRNYQAFITRYNVYFNGEQHYKETLKEMEDSYEDDYNFRLFMHPAEAYARSDAPQPVGSFDRSIEKAQKAIQLHSIKKPPRRRPGHSKDPEYRKWMRRSEYNPFLHNAWMMMGRSRYFNGDFLGAASTFYYVAKHFTWLPSPVVEAKLWQARCYCAMNWLFEAEMILSRVKPSELVSDDLRELYNFVYADFYILSDDYAKAIPMLTEVVGYAKGAQKSRLNFLLGQLYVSQGDRSRAYEAFKHAASGSSYRMKFNARMKQSEVYSAKDITPEVKALRRMARYGRNKEYLDRIYYAIGNLYLSQGDTVKAIDSYRTAVERSLRGGMDKAVAQLALGDLYYRRRRYDLAQPCYAEALAVIPSNYHGYMELKKRSDVLDELGVYSQNIFLNDSLLRLSTMPEAERMRVIDGIISGIKKREREEAENQRREEYLAGQVMFGQTMNHGNAATPNSITLNTDKSWYFYNPAAREAGRTEFQRRWGARKLEDDWRRHDKQRSGLIDFDSEEIDEVDNDMDEGGTEGVTEKQRTSARQDDPHYPEYYLKQIPATDLERNIAREVIQDGLYNSGVILKNKLEDFPAADAEWNRLLSEYPDNVYRLDIYYNEYLMNMRMSRNAEAEKWRGRILAEFPDSKLGQAMRDSMYIDRLKEMEKSQEDLYVRTYDDYLADRNGEVHKAYLMMSEKYPMSPLMPKFIFLHALAFVTEDKPAEFKAALDSLLERYPDSEFTPMASAYLKGLRQGRELRSGSSNLRSMVWSTRLTGDADLVGDSTVTLDFDTVPSRPHYVALLFDLSATPRNQLLYDVARHNFSTYVVRDFDLEMMSFGGLGVLIVKGFENMTEAEQYRAQLLGDADFHFNLSVRPIIISRGNFELLLDNGASFDDYLRFVGESEARHLHETILPPSDYLPPEALIELYQPNH